jgi:hypothetical protein
MTITQMTLKDKVGLAAFVLFSAHVVFNLLFLGIFGQNPSVPGDVVKLSPATSVDIFLSRFYAFGGGTFEGITPETSRLKRLGLPWPVVARNPSVGMWSEKISISKSTSVGKGTINANVIIPFVSISKRTVIPGRITISGYLPRPAGPGLFENTVAQITSEPLKLVLYPSSMTWLVRQSYSYIFSIFGACIAAFFCPFSRKSKKQLLGITKERPTRR